MGVDMNRWTPWLDRPVTLSDPGLFEGTTHMMDDLRRQQECQAAITAQMHPAPVGPPQCTAKQTPETSRPTVAARAHRSKKQAKKPHLVWD